MIQEFSVENFLSFGDRQSISFEATSDKKYLDELTVEVRPGVRLLKVAMIYGPNASGKTNLLSAIQALWRILFDSRPTKDNPTISYTPFALRKGQPTTFDIVFYANTEKFDYHVEYNSDKIIFESMHYYPNGTKALFYERGDGGIEFGKTLGLSKIAADRLKSNTLDNHSVLSTFGKTNIEEPGTKIETLYNWIRCNIHELDMHSIEINIVDEAEKNPNLKDFIVKTLNVSDFNIVDFKIEKKPLNFQSLSDNADQGDDVQASVDKRIVYYKDIKFTHRTVNGDFELGRHWESKGTLFSFPLIRKLYDLTNSNCVHMIDEIGESLHLDLIRHYLLLFIRNSGNSQLIFTTHNQLLLNEDFVRRDMVWITEKSPETAETELIPVTSYSLHPNKSLFNSYNIGQLGGKPTLGSTLIEDEED